MVRAARTIAQTALLAAMIAYVKGILAEKSPQRAIVEAGGVGYELAIPVSTYDRLPATGREVKILAFHVVREDDEALYGFATSMERELFAKLTGVNGVGPKIALAILSGASFAEISLAIASADAKRIAAIKGVGKKTAEKIVLELRDKINAIEAMALSSGEKNAARREKAFLLDARKALSALGFTDEISSKMVAKVLSEHPEADSTEAVVKFALKQS